MAVRVNDAGDERWLMMLSNPAGDAFTKLIITALFLEFA